MRHPAEFFIKYLLIRDVHITDAQILKSIQDWGFLAPEDNYLGFLRQELNASSPPQGFDPANRVHRPSMQYLRDMQVYELFYPTSATEEAWANLADVSRRQVVEQIIMARLDFKTAAKQVNMKYKWHLTEDGLRLHRHFFWNISLLTFDQWGRYLYDRSSMYDRYMGLLQAPRELAYFHLRFDQAVESKDMIKRAQHIAYFNLEEVNLVPGVRPDKIKAVSVLTKALTDCHAALSTSDMAISAVLKDFEKWRVEHPEIPAPDIRQLAPGGNYTGSGVEDSNKSKAH